MGSGSLIPSTSRHYSELEKTWITSLLCSSLPSRFGTKTRQPPQKLPLTPRPAYSAPTFPTRERCVRFPEPGRPSGTRIHNKHNSKAREEEAARSPGPPGPAPFLDDPRRARRRLLCQEAGVPVLTALTGLTPFSFPAAVPGCGERNLQRPLLNGVCF